MYLWVNKETASFNVHTVGWSLNVKNNYLSKVISNNLSKVAKFFFLIKYSCDQNFYQDILAISNFSSLLADFHGREAVGQKLKNSQKVPKMHFLAVSELLSDSLTAIYIELNRCYSHHPILLTQGQIWEISGKISKVLVNRTPSYQFTLNRTEINQNWQCALGGGNGKHFEIQNRNKVHKLMECKDVTYLCTAV